jgi:hypothetical protein
MGAWPIGVSGIITSYIALLAYLRRGDTFVTKTDWMFLIAALCALPLWFLTSEPVWAVITLTVSDLIGFGPTVRRAYSNPHEESIVFFTLSATRNLLVLLALDHYSLTTVLFPAAVGLACLLLSLMLAYRRHSLANLSGESSFVGRQQHTQPPV